MTGYHESYIERGETEMENTKSVSYNRGYSDGKESKKMKNPIHTNWKGNHCNPEYEKGYWAGYNS